MMQNSTKKKRKKSLGKSMRRHILLVAFAVFFASTLLNAFISNVELTAMLSLTGQTSAAFVSKLISGIDGFEEYAGEVMETYRSIPEDIRVLPDSEEYREYFADFEDKAFVREAREKFDGLGRIEVFSDFYVSAYDEDTDAMVCLFSPNERVVYEERPIGDWDETDEKELADLLNADVAAESGAEEDIGSGINIKTTKAGETLTSGMPIRNSEGEVIAFSQAEVTMAAVTATTILFSIAYFVVLLLVIVLVTVASRVFVSRRIVKPIRRISKAAGDYSQGRQDGNTETAYFTDLDITTRDELEDLSDVMSGMEKDIAVYENNLMQATAERERLQTELSVAAAIQKEMLPQCPAFTERSDFRIFASMSPAKEVGGDFYDFFLLDDDHLCLVMADVSGKGIPAALFMMSSMIIIHNLAAEGYSAGEILEKANNQICSSNQIDMFVTVWLGILDLKTGVITAANAGHEYPVVRQAGDDYELLKDRHGFVVGGLDGIHYKEYTITLTPGSSIFLYTDGLAEASDKKDELFGTDRMVAALNKGKERTPEEVLQQVQKDVDAFVDGAPQFDDLTMMCLTYCGPEKAEEKEIYEPEKNVSDPVKTEHSD